MMIDEDWVPFITEVTDRQTEIATPWAPVEAKNWDRERQSLWRNPGQLQKASLDLMPSAGGCSVKTAACVLLWSSRVDIHIMPENET